MSMSRSCDVFQQIKEFERTSTTVVNAYVGPVPVDAICTASEQRLTEENGYDRPGARSSSRMAASPRSRTPARLAAGGVLSGPAGGVAGAAAAARQIPRHPAT